MKRTSIYSSLIIISSISLSSCGGSGTSGGTFSPSNYTTTAIDPAQRRLYSHNLSGEVTGVTTDGSKATLYATSAVNFALGNTQTITMHSSFDHMTPMGIATDGTLLFSGSSDVTFTAGPVVFADPTATPVLPTLPIGVTSLVFPSQNDSQQIVLLHGSSGNCYYYSSPAASPTMLTKTNGDRPLISNSGVIELVLNSGERVVYPTPTSAPVTIAANKDDIAPSLFTMDNKLIGAAKVSGVLQAAYFLPTNYGTPIFLPVPAGTTDSALFHVNSQGVGAGYYRDAAFNFHACIWPTLSSQPVDFRGTGSSSFDYAEYIFDDGTIIAAHANFGAGHDSQFVLTRTH